MSPKIGQDDPKLAPSWPKIAPSLPQDGPKSAFKTIKNLRKINVFALGLHSGHKLSEDDHKMAPRWPQEPKSSVILRF